MGFYLSNLACFTNVVYHRLSGTCSCAHNLPISLLKTSRVSVRDMHSSVKFEINCTLEAYKELLYCTYVCIYHECYQSIGCFHVVVFDKALNIIEA